MSNNLLIAPLGWKRLYYGRVQYGDKYWHFHLASWILVNEDMVGCSIDQFHGIIRRKQ